MLDNGYIKLNRSKTLMELIKRRHTAFVLLSLIALRARRSGDGKFGDLEANEAYIGDYENYGVSLQKYRTDKKFLETFKFSTYRVTNKGTIAKLLDTTIFDINSDTPNKRTNKHLTNDQQTPNKRLTTNKNERSKELKNERNIHVEISPNIYQDIMKHYDEIFGKQTRSYASWKENADHWLKIYSLEDIKQAITNWKYAKGWIGSLEEKTLTFLFRTKNKAGACDYIDDLLNQKVQIPTSSNDPLAIAARERGRRV